MNKKQTKNRKYGRNKMACAAYSRAHGGHSESKHSSNRRRGFTRVDPIDLDCTGVDDSGRHNFKQQLALIKNQL